MDKTAKIIEIFSSVQGEGLRIGERQIFIRFHGCNLSCIYCDVDRNKRAQELDIEDILEEIDSLNSERIHNTVSITGGEPLLHNIFLKELLPKVTDMGFKVYLETNGTLARELDTIIENIDIISVDIKLPSVSKNKACWKEHEEFLRAAFKKEFFVKVVVAESLDIADFDKAIKLMKDVSIDIPFVIQPETKKDLLELNIKPERLLELQEKALKSLNNVLVIPQAHRMMGLR
jgi:organic radical activating enzyme